MSPLPCDRCREGRHVRCRRGDCTCTMCWPASGEPKLRPKRYKRKAAPKKPRRQPAARPADGGRHGNSGSTLPHDTQVKVAVRLRQGESLSAISRELGVSRDQIRTVRSELERAGEDLSQAAGTVPAATLGRVVGELRSELGIQAPCIFDTRSWRELEEMVR